MAGNAVNRETHRDYLAGLLETALVGEGLAAQVVYNYRVGDIQGQSPVVVVSSDGTERERAQTGAEKWDTYVYLWVFVFVAYALEGTTWGEDDCEDRLDLIDKKIADVVMDNRSQAQNGSVPWDGLYFNGRSSINDFNIGGQEYRIESIPVKARVIHG